jgi:hypothetical protein
MPMRTRLSASFGGGGRWGVRTAFANGLPHELLVLTDLSRTLREEEERTAWRRLVRVLGPG